MVVYREKYISLCGEALELAKNLLTNSPSLQDLTQLQQVIRHGGSASVVTFPAANVAKNSPVDKSSPKTRSRANTVIAFKTMATDDMATTSKSVKHRGVLKSKGNKVERSQTFLGKEEKKERPHTAHNAYSHRQSHHWSSSSASGGTGIDDLPDGGNIFITMQL